MKTYYDLLNVETSSSPQEIKRAFRKRAKELHPDTNPHDPQTIDRMRSLLRAYETLIDPERREEYDRTHYIIAHEYRFDYRQFLKDNPDDPLLQSKLVFYDLLHDHEAEAISVYERLRSETGFVLCDQIDREDFMDCAFLLAEVYERRGDFLKSFELLAVVVDFEFESPYFRHFFVEVTERLRTMICFKMPGVLPPQTVIDCIETLLVRPLHYKDIAFYLKKAAELYLDLGNRATATSYLTRAMEIDEKLGGTKKLLERLSRRVEPSRVYS